MALLAESSSDTAGGDSSDNQGRTSGGGGDVMDQDEELAKALYLSELQQHQQVRAERKSRRRKSCHQRAHAHWLTYPHLRCTGAEQHLQARVEEEQQKQKEQDAPSAYGSPFDFSNLGGDAGDLTCDAPVP